MADTSPEIRSSLQLLEILDDDSIYLDTAAHASLPTLEFIGWHRGACSYSSYQVTIVRQASLLINYKNGIFNVQSVSQAKARNSRPFFKFHRFSFISDFNTGMYSYVYNKKQFQNVFRFMYCVVNLFRKGSHKSSPAYLFIWKHTLKRTKDNVPSFCSSTSLTSFEILAMVDMLHAFI